MANLELDRLQPAAQQPAKPRSSLSRKQIVSGIIVALVALALNVVLLALPIPYAQFAQYGYIGIFILSFLSSAAKGLPIPVPAVLLIGAHYLNPYLVGLVYGIASTVGEITGYGIGIGGRTVLQGNSAYTRVAGWMERYGAFALFLCAAIPNPFFTVAGVTAGAVRMPLWKFFAAIGAGRTLRGIILALIFIHIPNIIPQLPGI